METFLEGGNFLGGTNSGGGGVKFFGLQNVSICNGYRVSDIFRIGDKIIKAPRLFVNLPEYSWLR